MCGPGKTMVFSRMRYTQHAGLTGTNPPGEKQQGTSPGSHRNGATGGKSDLRTDSAGKVAQRQTRQDSDAGQPSRNAGTLVQHTHTKDIETTDARRENVGQKESIHERKTGTTTATEQRPTTYAIPRTSAQLDWYVRTTDSQDTEKGKNRSFQ